MDAGGLKGGKPSKTSVAAAGKTHPEDIQVQGGAGGGGVVNDSFPPQREGGVSGDRDFRGGM